MNIQKAAILSFFFLFILNLSLVMPAYSSVEGGWEYVDQAENIKVYKKKVIGNSILAFKGEGVLDFPIEKVATVIFDTSRAPEWIDDLVSSKIVKWVSEDEFIEYDHIGTPFIIKDRDFVSSVKVEVDQARKEVIFRYRSVEDPNVPKTSFVRGELMNTVYTLKAVENGAKTHFEGEIHCDPKGTLPKWIVNFFQKKWPLSTLKNLRKQLSKDDVTVLPRFSGLGLLPRREQDQFLQ